MNRLKFSLALLFAFATSIISFAHDFEVNSIYYNKNSDGSSVSVTYKGSNCDSYTNEYSGKVVIPNQVTYGDITYSVTSIGQRAFYDCSGLTSVTIPNSVTSIGEWAFSYCSGLISITIPNSVTSIGGYAFYRCYGLTSITIPNSVTSIGNYAFCLCSGLTSVIFNAENCNYLSSSWLSDSPITSFTIGENVKTIPAYLCDGLSQLTSITIPNSVTSIGKLAFFGCSRLTSVTIPNSVTYIGREAFDDTPFYNNMPNGVIYLNSVLYKYKGTMPNNSKIDINDGTISISPYAFEGCTGLTSVTIPNSVTSIGSFAFYNCSGLTSITIPNSVTSIDYAAFSGCSNLIKSAYPNRLTDPFESGIAIAYPSDGIIADDGVIFDKNKNTIYFAPLNISSVTIPTTITSIGNSAFSGCSGLTKVNISDIAAWCNISFGYYSDSNPLYYAQHLYLNGNEITNLVIPNSVTSIRDYAFKGCSGLTSITIPNSVTSIGDDAFKGCSGLTKVNISDITAWCNISFGYYDSNPLYYAQHLYLNGNEITNLVIPNSVTSIRDYAFKGCSGLTSITIPNSVTSIGGLAFYDCSGLSSVTIGNSVTYIDGGAFKGCSGLTSITIPNSVTSIGNNAFEGCSGLTKVEISDIAAWCNISFSNYRSNPLYYAKHLYLNGNEVTNLVIPNSVTSIRDYAFYDCSGLTSISIPNSVTSIGDYAFCSCTGLTSVTIPNSVTSIGGGAFYDCSGLTSISIPNSVTSIGGYAFSGCSGLTSITIPNSVTSIGEKAFYNCSNLIKSAYPDNLNKPFSNGIIIAYPSDGIIDENGVIFDKNRNTIYFAPTNTRSVSIPNSVTSIGKNAFYGCSNLIKSAYPNHLKNPFESGIAIEYPTDGIIEDNGVIYDKNKNTVYFAPLNISSAEIPNSVTSIGDYAFRDCSGLTSVIFNAENCNSLSSNWLSGTAVTSFTIGENIKAIPAFLCYCLSQLKEITIPNSVNTIGNGAFWGCSGLTSIQCDAITPPSLSILVFNGVDKQNCSLIVPDGSLEAYKAANQWKDFLHIGGVEEFAIEESNISIENGKIINIHNENIDVYNLSGIKVYSGNKAEVELNSGVYIVVIGNKAVKIAL